MQINWIKHFQKNKKGILALLSVSYVVGTVLFCKHFLILLSIWGRSTILALSSICRWENWVDERLCKAAELIKCWSQVWLQRMSLSFHTPIKLYAPTTVHYFQFLELICSFWPWGLDTYCSLGLDCPPQKISVLPG